MRIADLLRPETTELNRLPARAPLVAQPTADDARAGRESPWRYSLDGAWRFRLVEHPDAAPDGWAEPDTDHADWATIAVPGSWTRQGVGDHPHYTNVQMPWDDLDPPATPERNPTGLYRTTFSLPPGVAEGRRRLVLHLGGAESVAVVWCNGVAVGMGKDSRLPSEFDLTPFVHEGENLLAVMVIRYSDATWIEDQDHWWHAGLHRSVHLETRALGGVDDLVVVADYEPDTGEGHLEVTAVVRDGAGARIRVTLETDGGDVLATAPVAEVAGFDGDEPFARLLAAYTYDGPVARVGIDVAEVAPWSAESPTRYLVVTELLDADGAMVEAHATWTGFRRVEVGERRLIVNGRAVVLHGVNRHDHHPDTGKTLTLDELRADLVAMKRHNIDAVRTAHYPNDHRLLDLCDEVGLYVVGEANVESHARLRSLSSDPRYLTAITERSRRMVLRDRNHPCVIGWSLGNESGDGPAFDAAAAWIRAADRTRFVQYEGATERRFNANQLRDDTETERAPSASERLVTDVVCPMYTPVGVIVSWARWAERTELDDRPLILCEYSHAMGNSNGSITDYVDAFHTEPALGGGFVWDWRDQGLSAADDRGRPFWAYGGHFGDEPNDANFCVNGLVGPDLVPHPGLEEYRWACRPVVAEHLEGRRVRFTNRRRFRGTDDLRLTWTTHVDGVATETGEFDLDIPPESSRVVTIPLDDRIRPGVETHLTLVWGTRVDAAWAEAGHVVAWDQCDLTRGAVPVATLAPGVPERVRVEVGDEGIEGIWFDDRQVVLGDVAGCLWRAPTDNDGVKVGWMAEVAGVRRQWLGWGLDRVESSVDRVRIGDGLGGQTIELRRRLIGTEDEAFHVSRLLVTDEGVRFQEELSVPNRWRDVPRVGIRFEVPAELSELEWLGPGPWESYPDRCRSAMVARWPSTVDAQYHPFVVPQEHGAHVETRWFSLTDGDGFGARVDGDPRFVFSARRYHDADLTAARTLAELDPADTIEVHVDAAVRGLGTAACGPDTLAPYLVRPAVYSWTWFLRPVGP